MIHCPTGQLYSIQDYNIWLTLRQFINFPVAVFIFLAGYFMNPKKVECNYKNFLWKRGIIRLFVPYLIWSCIYIAKTVIFERKSFNFIQFTYILISGKAATPFYYIIVLLQLTIITPWLMKHRRKWMYLITLIYLLGIYAYNIATGLMPPLYETLFPAWFIFYLFGMDCRDGKFNNIIMNVNKTWVIIVLLLSIAEAYILKKIGCEDGFIVSQIKISSFIYATTLILWLQKKETNIKTNLIAVIGDCSYGIFYCHLLVLWIVRKAVQILVGNDIWIINFGLCFLLTSVGSTVVVLSGRKIMKKLKCEKFLLMIGF